MGCVFHAQGKHTTAVDYFGKTLRIQQSVTAGGLRSALAPCEDGHISVSILPRGTGGPIPWVFYLPRDSHPFWLKMHIESIWV